MEGVIAANLRGVIGRIDMARAAAAGAAQRITLVAVSKTHPEAAVREALMAGQLVFGENRVQEALTKFPA